MIAVKNPTRPSFIPKVKIGEHGGNDHQNNTSGSVNQKNKLTSFLSIAIPFCLVLLLFKFVLLSAFIPTSSMFPTLSSPCWTLSNRLSYKFGSTPQRGDIVVFQRDNGEEKYYIKRIIGLPGDSIEIVGGQTYVNGELLDEPYLAEKTDDSVNLSFEVPEGSYFMMGDNRNNSYDSRYWEEHFVPLEFITAKMMWST